MKKILILLSFGFSFTAFAQQSKLIINNYTGYDYRGVISAAGPNCYPSVSNTYYPDPTYLPLIVTAGNSANVDLYSTGLVPFWDVQTSATNPVVIRPFNHPSLNSSGTISQNTNWYVSKFGMYYSGTTTSIPYMNASVSNGVSACSTAPSYYSNPNTTFEAEWFTIGSFSYLELY